MALSHLILGKNYKNGQVVAVVFVMGGIGMVVLLGPPSAPAHHGSWSRTEYVSRSVAAGMCLGGAFMNAFCAVVTEATPKQTLEEEENRLLEQQIINETHCPPSKLLLSNAYSMWTTRFSFGILLVPVLWSGQLGHALEILKNATCNVEQIDDEDASQSGGTAVSAVVLSYFMLLGLSQFAERLSKHWICVCDSAVTFSLVQAARRLSGVRVLAILFREEFPWSMVMGSACSAVSFTMHSGYGRPELVQQSSDGSHQYELVATTTASKTADMEAHTSNVVL
jgi:drug/metabolite transporter (DMT)-like permease